MSLRKNHTKKIALAIYGVTLAVLTFMAMSNIFEHPTFADELDSIQSSSEEHFVTIYDRGAKLTIKTNAITVAEALDRAKIQLLDTDIVEPGRTDFINAEDFNINIYRSRPVLIIDGNIRKYVMTASYDPRLIAMSAGLAVYDGDDIELVPNQNFLETGNATAYRITRNGGTTLTMETILPFTEETIEDSSLADGQTRLVQSGEDGRRIVKYNVGLVDGVEVSREQISEEVIVESKPRIIAVGSKKSVPPEWEICAGWAREAGVSEADLYSALTLIYHESGCRVDAENQYSGAYGIPQSLPGSKMASAGPDWQTNPVTQIRWMISYVNGRYGGWQGALDFWWCTGTCKGIQKNSYWY